MVQREDCVKDKMKNNGYPYIKREFTVYIKKVSRNGPERGLCEGQGKKLRLHAGGHARVVYIKREFTVYNKKVLPKPWARDKGKKIYRDSRSSGFGILKEVKNVVKNS